MQIFDHCLTRLHIHPEQPFQTLPHWYDFAAEKRESSGKQSKIDSFFSRSSVARDSQAKNFLEYCNVELYHFLNHECVVFLFP